MVAKKMVEATNEDWLVPQKKKTGVPRLPLGPTGNGLTRILVRRCCHGQVMWKTVCIDERGRQVKKRKPEPPREIIPLEERIRRLRAEGKEIVKVRSDGKICLKKQGRPKGNGNFWKSNGEPMSQPKSRIAKKSTDLGILYEHTYHGKKIIGIRPHPGVGGWGAFGRVAVLPALEPRVKKRKPDDGMEYW